MGENLRQKTLGALIWNLLDRTGQQVLTLVVTIIVANILQVEDYALTGMLVFFTALANLIIDSGFSAALIQRKTIEEKDLSSVFFLNLTISVAIYLILVICTPLIAGFFDEPRLRQIAPVVFLAIPLNALSLVQGVLLNRQVNFKPLFKADVTASFVSGLIAVVLAVLGYGVWALVLQSVSLAFVRTIFLWINSSWRPIRSFDFKRIKDLSSFAMSLLAAGLLNTLFLNVYNVIIGKLFPARQLGYFTQSGKFCDPVVTLIYASIQNATYPVLSQMQDEGERLLEAYRKSIQLTAMLAFPMMVGLMITAKPLIQLLLKDDWWPAIPYLRWLCIGGIFTILTAINNNFIKVSGETHGVLLVEIWKVLALIMGIMMSWQYGVMAMVATFAAVRIVVYLINLLYTQGCTSYEFLQQLWDILPFLLLSAVMGAAIYPLEWLISNNLLLIISEVILGMAIYIIGLSIFSKTLFRECIQLLKMRFSKNK